MQKPTIGDVAMRYPGGDPENGPAYPQRLTANGWECAEHKFHYGQCVRCGEPQPGLDPRKQKRFERKAGMDDHVYEAYLRGQWDHHHRRNRANPYPAGRRHDEYERGRS